ncbi:MAG: WYL domain-containing protein [Luteolibacter sp.]
MGNASNRDQWAVRERWMFIERLAWWRGVVNRGDVREIFGISAAQVSADLQGYQELNPVALAYNVRSKRYEALPGMACVMHAPRIEEAVRLFLGEEVMGGVCGGSAVAEARVDVFQPLVRRAGEQVERRVFLALDQGRRLTIKYWSVNGGKSSLREIAPRALGHDGYRWHVRAWCFVNAAYRDFNLSRIEAAEWPGEIFVPEVADVEWETFEVLRLQANSQLSKERRKAMELDYGMVNGVLEVRIRRAMRRYFFEHWRIPVEEENGGALVTHLELVGVGDWGSEI